MRVNEIIAEGLRTENPCWKGYKPVGTKKKAGKTVPNCVPKESVEEGLSWTSLDEGLTVEDKISIFEEFYTRGNLTESTDSDTKDYFESLFKLSAVPAKGKKYIVVPLSLINNKLVQLDAPTVARFVSHENGGLTFNTPDGEKTYPSKAMRDLSIFNTFTFSSISAYDKFRTAVSLRFDITLPSFNPGQQNVEEDWQKANRKDKTSGMSKKAVAAYRRENPGSKLQTAVTTKPSKLKKGSKASKRRKSYCSRSKGQMDMHNISCAKTPDKAICKARRRWNCE
jgi:hypothetical protein